MKWLAFMAVLLWPSTMGHAGAPVEFPMCQPGEVGDWAISSDGKHGSLYLATTPHPQTIADIKCWVEGTHKIMVLSGYQKGASFP